VRRVGNAGVASRKACTVGGKPSTSGQCGYRCDVGAPTARGGGGDVEGILVAVARRVLAVSRIALTASRRVVAADDVGQSRRMQTVRRCCRGLDGGAQAVDGGNKARKPQRAEHRRSSPRPLPAISMVSLHLSERSRQAAAARAHRARRGPHGSHRCRRRAGRSRHLTADVFHTVTMRPEVAIRTRHVAAYRVQEAPRTPLSASRQTQGGFPLPKSDVKQPVLPRTIQVSGLEETHSRPLLDKRGPSVEARQNVTRDVTRTGFALGKSGPVRNRGLESRRVPIPECGRGSRTRQHVWRTSTSAANA
jgi:hypothetical protein